MKLGKQCRRLLSLLLIFVMLLMNMSMTLPIKKVVAAGDEDQQQSTRETDDATTNGDTSEETGKEESNSEEPVTEEEGTDSSNDGESGSNDDSETSNNNTEQEGQNSESGAQEGTEEETEEPEAEKTKEEETTEKQTSEENTGNEQLELQQDTTDFDELPELLITEIMPNNSGSDDYEYFEVYNNSNRTINLDYYTFIYHYTDNSYDDKTMTFAPSEIDPGEVKIFWPNNSGKTTQEFKDHHDLDVTDDAIIEYESSNFANGGNRGVVINNPANETVIEASYLGEDVESGKGVSYTYPESGTSMDKDEIQAEGTPGQVNNTQIPEEKVSLPESSDLTINHETLSQVQAGQNLVIEAEITNDSNNFAARLHYQTESGKDYESIEMNETEENLYQAEISGQELRSGTLTYYISAVGKNNRSQEPDSPAEIEIEQAGDNNNQDLPHILVTELAPNTAGAEEYEFFELYNNTNHALDLNQYAFKYVYTSSGKERVFHIPDTTMESQETLVFWYNNTGKEQSDFNDKFNTDLQSDELVEITDTTGLPGFANGGGRALVLTDNQNNEVIYADYSGDDNNNDGKDIQYQYPLNGTEMIKYETLADPTPGAFENAQVPDTPVDVAEPSEDQNAPEIDHTSVETATSYSSLEIEATIEDDEKMPSASLYYKNENADAFHKVTMRAEADDLTAFTAEIPGSAVASDITYYIEATDGTNVESTEESTITVATEEDAENIPPFLVTEIVPDTTNVDGADGYEFIEIYNNTDQPINFSDYQLQYRYDNLPDRDTHWPSEPEDMEIPPQETMVFWVINGSNNDETIEDFNNNYGTSLNNDNIAKIYTPGLSNGGIRSLVVATNTDHELAIAHYNEESEDADDTSPDKGIVYKFPLDGSNVMDKVSAGEEDATPGSVEDYQVPETPVEVPEDNEKPDIEDQTGITEIHESVNIDFAANIDDNTQVRTAKLFYRSNDQEEYQTLPVQVDPDDGLYHGTIYAPDLIATEEIEYYFVASDGPNQAESDPKTITINNDRSDEPLRFNISNNDVISGNNIIKGTSEQDDPEEVSLLLDDKEIQEDDTFRAVENTAYLSFEVNGINTYFQNAVTIDDEVIHIFDDWMSQWTTITVPIDPELLSTGDNTFTIRAGNKATPFVDNSGENRDDFDMRDVRLILADETILRDGTYSDPAEVLDMGDNGTQRIAEDFTFDIIESQADSKGWNWDTTSVQDGEHVLTVKDNSSEIQTTVNVDNTAPSITTNLEDGKEYKGTFSIQPDIEDTIAGVDNTTIMLDEEEISVPYETSSGELASGEHELMIAVEDTVGNKTTKTIRFSIADEHPNQPENIGPEMAETIDGDPILKVNVTDPTEDDLNVGFYEGFQYDSIKVERVKSYYNTAETEPPQTAVPENEEPFTEDNILQTAEKDGEYMTTESTTEFPYHRFDVTVDESIDENDTVELAWNGKSLEDRKVTMYAWNHNQSGWKVIDSTIAGKEDFQLNGIVSVKEFVSDQKVNVLVQDEIPSSSEEYDYTFAWISDTQYYSESYPEIFDQQTQWIADNQEDMNVAYTFHTGDLVNQSNKEEQWNRADEYMQTLDDADVPYGVLAGNHDVAQKTNDYTEYYKYFGADRFEDYPFFGGSYKNNRGHYDLISVDGNDYIMVYLGWGIEDEGIEWVNEVLEEHPNRKAVLNFHEYLLASGSRHPEGQELYEKLVIPNENVFAVLAGHYHESQTLVDEIDDNEDGQTDRKVYQLLANYQAGPEGGQGYMRLLHFDTENNNMIVNTYSPYMDDYNYYDTEEYPEKDEFTLDLDLAAEEKSISTDHFEVKVYSDNEIGTVENVASGETAEIVWEGLEEGETYSWYTKATDEYTGETLSNIWTFEKGKDEDREEPPSEDNEHDNNGGSNGGSNSGSSNSDGNNQDNSEESSQTDDLYEEERSTAEDGTERLLHRVDAKALADNLEDRENAKTVTFNVDTNEDIREEVVFSKEALDVIRNHNESTVVEIQAQPGTVRLPISEIKEDMLREKLGVTAEEMENVEFNVSIATSEADEVLEDNNLDSVSSVVDYTITVKTDNTETVITNFDRHIERSMNSDEELNPEQMVVVKLDEEENSFIPVPTIIDGNTATFKSQSFSKYTIVENDAEFTDIPDDFWAKDYFEKLGSHYIFQGREDGSVAPGEEMRRAQFAVLITRALGLTSSQAYDGRFSDVAADDWFSEELQPAIEHGIIQGREDGTFAPNETVTRQQAASMLSRAMDITGFEEEKLDQDKTINAFDDTTSIGDWAKEDIERLLQAGIMEGRQDGTIFDPKSGTTRAQLAKMLDEYLVFVEFSN